MIKKIILFAAIIGLQIQFVMAQVTTITGTANQVTTSSATGAVTLSLPQNIATSSTPTFGGLTLNGTFTGTASTFTSAPALGAYQVGAISNSVGHTSYGGLLVLNSTGAGAYFTAGDASVSTTYLTHPGDVTFGATAGVKLHFRAGATDEGGITINTSGNVGVGTTDPQGYKLAVNGNMIAESVKVKVYANWPDHVFEPSHNLPDLKETEQFIKKNKHLPEIPSAKEVAENGINLGEMDAKLLQKIEELTLHLIELNKTIQKQQKEIDQFKKILI